MSQPAATTFFKASSSMTAVRCSPALPSHCDIWFSVWAMRSSSASALPRSCGVISGRGMRGG